LSYSDYERRLAHQVKKYIAKSGVNAVAGMSSRYDSSINLSMLNFAWNIDLNLKIYIDIKITWPGWSKAQYGTAIYGKDVYDPATVLGVLTADSLTKWLTIKMVRCFLPANERGYKYTLPQSFYFLFAELPMLETVAFDPVWYVRSRKIDATRNWTAFFDMGFFDVNAYPTEAYTDPVTGDVPSEVLIRVSDMLESVFDWATFESGEYVGVFDYPPYSLLDLDNLYGHTHRINNISANFFDTALFDRAPFAGIPMPYPELYLLSPNLVAYMPVFDVANFDFDVYFTTVEFDEDLVNSIIENAKQTQQIAYTDFTQLSGSERMHTLYTVHAAYQVNKQYQINQILEKYGVPRINVGLYHAFSMEYVYKHMAEQLVDPETVITKYIRLGLNETVLRALAAMTSR